MNFHGHSFQLCKYIGNQIILIVEIGKYIENLVILIMEIWYWKSGNIDFGDLEILVLEI